MTREENRVVARGRLLWAIALRAVAASVLLGSAILLRVKTPGLASAADVYFVLIAVTYGLTGLYAATVRLVDRWPWIADLHFAGDIALVSVLVILNGGIGSVFASLYAVPIVAAGAVQLQRGGIAIAALAALAYVGVVIAQYTGPLGAITPAAALPPASDAFFRVTMTAGGFLAVGALTGWLAEGWHRADQRLATASTAIASLQAFNQRVIDSLPGGLLTTTEDGVVASVNRAAVTITGKSADQLLGVHVSEALQLPTMQLDGGCANGPRRFEFDFVKPAGQRLALGLGIAPIGADGGARGYLFTFQDVTEHKRRERDAQRQKRLAALGEMAAGIAHEIRNPLASMAGSIQVLRRELPLDPEQAQLLDIVLRESERLNDIIRDFLAYARPQRPAGGHVDLGRAVNETASLLRHGPECHAGHRVVVHIDAPEIYCEGDEGQIRQVLWNLSINALRAMPGGGTLTIRLSHEGEGAPGHALVVVADTGVGMSAEQQEALFQPFSSVSAQGTGLGLAIAHRIVTDHGGTISVESALAKGTTVRILLPATRRESVQPVAFHAA